MIVPAMIQHFSIHTPPAVGDVYAIPTWNDTEQQRQSVVAVIAAAVSRPFITVAADSTGTANRDGNGDGGQPFRCARCDLPRTE
jgi:hypothetical protein